MNILTDSLPEYIEIGNKKYRINTDFRVWIKIELLLQDNSVSFCEKISALLTMCYIDIPDTLEQAIEGMLSFFYIEEHKKNKKPQRAVKPVFSFEYDSRLIYAAFYERYGIDLCRAKLHWWQFNALFYGLDDTTRIYKIMKYRATDPEKIRDKATREYYRKLKSAYSLPDLRTEEERQKDLADAVSALF